MKKNKVLKVSMATLALLMSAGYVAQDYQVTPTYAETTKIGDSAQLISTATTWKYLDNNVDPELKLTVMPGQKQIITIQSGKVKLENLVQKKEN